MAQQWDETTLMAYADGQLDAETAHAVEASLANDPEALAMVAQLRLSATAVAGAFDGSLHQPVPPALLRAATTRTERRFSVSRPFFWRMAAALAFIMIGIAGAQIWRNGEVQSVRLAGQTVATADQRFQAALVRALNQTAANDSVTYSVAGGDRQGRVTLLGPVATPLGVPCRAFRHEPAQADQTPSEGVACQNADGSWNVLTMPLPAPSSR